jgi:hypothetical protein
LAVGLDIGEAEELELKVLSGGVRLDLDVVLLALVLDGDWDRESVESFTREGGTEG